MLYITYSLFTNIMMCNNIRLELCDAINCKVAAHTGIFWNYHNIFIIKQFIFYFISCFLYFVNIC